MRATLINIMYGIGCIFLLALVLAITGCGGGGGTSSAPVAAAPVARECLPSPYFPICNGSARKYRTVAIESASVTAGTWAVTDIVTGAPVGGGTLEYNTAVTSCSSYPGVSFFQEQYAFGAAVPSLAASEADSVWSAEDGRQYIGEGHGHSGGFTQVLSAGEPILTLAPVAGESISTEYTQSMTGCGGALVPFTPVVFSTRYTTVEHLDSFTDALGHAWPDVWHTTLVEWLNLSGGQKYYDYYFSRNTGLVQADCWTANADHYACGRQDTLISEAL